MNKRRIVVTGIGVLTPLGNDLNTTWDGLINGRSGIAPITTFDVSQYSTRFGGQVKNFEAAQFFRNPKDARRCDRYTQLAFAATKQAYADSGLEPDKLNPERCSVLVGSGIGGLQTLEDQHSALVNRGPHRVSPFMIPMMISNMAAGLLAIDYNCQGPSFSVVTACATSNQAIGEAWRHIITDESDVVIAGGSEAAVIPLGLSGFGAMKALSTRNDAPEKASRPFDKDRDGFVLSEGAGIVILEELEHAKKRGARIYAEIVGYGATTDAYHMTATAPEGRGGARAVRRALELARLNPADVQYINAHGTSTPLGDVAESQGIKSVFGDHAKRVWVSSTKSMTGHMLGAAGAVELAACLKAIETGIVPPTINLEHPDPECDLDCVPNVAREGKIDVIVNNSFGFGGHNACIVAKKLL
ncbi:MAG: beta-ketoacyl-ACP synthase II [Verrucomicrobiales bacterium]|jgi:3-oxoacyl-[acyl-carrier-protein] synthase II|nr:beta-ketoacyl-ACP synthase II [Verrucomicrobiales bacterium]